MTNLHRLFPALLLALCWLPAGLNSAQETDRITITILYDNTTAVDDVQSDWGFACLVEGLEQTILFDTGTKSEVLLHNANVLGIDLNQVQVIVLSHDHRDHTGALAAVLERNPGIDVYLPVSFPATYGSIIKSYGAAPAHVSKAVELFEGAALTGEMGDRIKEQSLILETTRGLVIITGCSHQGIVEILERAAKLHQQDIYLVFGGFHLLRHTDAQVNGIIAQFKALGVNKCGATHCTGDDAITQFREAFGEKFMPMGVGRVVRIPD
jgi:7,8-dihydropterin-6-yl-methyl-4-(beta-D-ribofuranosyl)aminobenzene 5'-phosphate synthase